MLHQSCPSGQGRAGREVGGIRPPFIASLQTARRGLVGRALLEGQFLQLETGVPRSAVPGQKSGEVVAASVSSWTQIIFFLVRDGERSALPPRPGFAHPVNGCPELPAAGGVLGCISVVVWGEAFK